MNTWFQPISTTLGNEPLEHLLPVDTLFDGIYLPNQKLMLHFVSLHKIQNLATNYFADMNIQASALNLKCIHIWEDVYARHPQLVFARIHAIIGNRIRLHARATEGKRIDKPTAETFLNTNHLQQSVNAYYKFGLYANAELVAVATFSKSRMMTDGIVPYRSYELIRFASKAGVTVTGGLSKLLTLFIKEVHPAHMMTYTDNDWGTGEGYEKLGFSLVEKTAPIPFYVNPDTKERLTAKQMPGPTTPEWILVYNSGSNKYVRDNRDHTS